MAEASIWMPPRASQPRASRLAYAGSRRHSRNHATTNLNPRYLVAALPLGAVLMLFFYCVRGTGNLGS
jgi:hypothetical protein